MKLDSGIEGWLESAMREEVRDSIYTVEGSIKRMITDEERAYVDEKLKPLGFKVNCTYCETCAEYSEGTHPYHIERVNIS